MQIRSQFWAKEVIQDLLIPLFSPLPLELAALNTSGRSLTIGFIYQLLTLLEIWHWRALQRRFIVFLLFAHFMQARFFFPLLKKNIFSCLYQSYERFRQRCLSDIKCTQSLTCIPQDQVVIGKKKKSRMLAAGAYKIVYTLRFFWTALVGNNWRERCCLSVLLRVLYIIYSLFGIGTSASRDNHCPIIPFLFLCAAVSLSLFPIKKGKEKTHLGKKKKDDCHNLGTQKSSD